MGGFDQVVFRGQGRVILALGNTESLTVTTDENLLEHIETAVHGGALEIRTKEGADIQPTDPIEYRIEMMDLSRLEHAGVGSIDLAVWSADEGTIVLTGVGDVQIGTFVGQALTVEQTGVGSIFISGTVDQQNVIFDSPGSYEAEDLQTDTAVVNASGSGLVTVWITEALCVVADGLVKVRFYGNPELAKTVNHPATVTKMGDK